MQMIKIPYAIEREVNFHKRTNKTQELKQNSNAMQYIYIYIHIYIYIIYIYQMAPRCSGAQTTRHN